MIHSIRLPAPRQIGQLSPGQTTGPHTGQPETNSDLADLTNSQPCPNADRRTWMTGVSTFGVAGGLGLASSAASAGETVVHSLGQGHLLTSQGVVVLVAITAMALGALGLHLHGQNRVQKDRDYFRDLEMKRSQNDERLRAEGSVVERRPGSGICIVRRPTKNP
jgi:hypothetical protein